MILGLGIDLVEVARIRKSISTYGDRFTNRVFTAGERAYADSKANSAESYAARFAAKEAAMKALGTGWARGVTWTQIEVNRDKSGRPSLLLHAAARDLAHNRGVRRISLALTHVKEFASAVVIFED